jgi:hypothetical protein
VVKKATFQKIAIRPRGYATTATNQDISRMNVLRHLYVINAALQVISQETVTNPMKKVKGHQEASAEEDTEEDTEGDIEEEVSVAAEEDTGATVEGKGHQPQGLATPATSLGI